jgi:hypothetical protein
VAKAIRVSDPPEGPLDPESERRRRLLERTVPDLVRRLVERAIESGVEKLSEQPENLRNLVGELKLPKEVLGDVYAQIDDTKTGLYRVVAKEIRDVLEHTQLADEIVKVLTKLSFEIKTEIRFVPNDRAPGKDPEPEADGAQPPAAEKRPTLRPSVASEVTVKRDDKK